MGLPPKQPKYSREWAWMLSGKRAIRTAEEAHTSDQTSAAFVRPAGIRYQDTRGYLAVRIGRGLARQFPAQALGTSLPDAHFGVSATIFKDRIENFCQSAGANLPVIAIAHGIMKERWAKSELDQAARGNLGFLALQGAAIRYHSLIDTRGHLE
jgi:hypothetical protein